MPVLHSPSFQLVRVVSFNMGMCLPLMYAGWHCRYKQCVESDIYKVPSLYGLLGYIVAAAAIHDVLFYHGHR